MIKEKTIIVVGQRRSGTSLISGILYHLGVNVGADTTQISCKNIKGFFEDREIIIISQKMLRFMGVSWLGTISKYLENKVKYDTKLMNKFSNEISQYFKKKNKQYLVWGFKNVNHITFWHLYKNFLRNPYYIVITRDKNKIVSSLNNWHSGGKEKYIQTVNAYLQEIKMFCKNKNINKLELTYEKCLLKPVQIVDSIINFCQLTPTKKQRDDAIKHIAPSLNHY